MKTFESKSQTNQIKPADWLNPFESMALIIVTVVIESLDSPRMRRLIKWVRYEEIGWVIILDTQNCCGHFHVCKQTVIILFLLQISKIANHLPIAFTDLSLQKIEVNRIFSIIDEKKDNYRKILKQNCVWDKNVLQALFKALEL